MSGKSLCHILITCGGKTSSLTGGDVAGVLQDGLGELGGDAVEFEDFLQSLLHGL